MVGRRLVEAVCHMAGNSKRRIPVVAPSLRAICGFRLTLSPVYLETFGHHGTHQQEGASVNGATASGLSNSTISPSASPIASLRATANFILMAGGFDTLGEPPGLHHSGRDV